MTKAPKAGSEPWYDDPEKLDEEDSRPTPENLAVRIEYPDYITKAIAKRSAGQGGG